MLRILISYRREDSAGHAGRLYDLLVDRFGEGVFMDIDTIPPGADFVEAIRNAVAQADVVIALIGRQWLTVTSGSGQRRIDDPDDFVRIEIATALERGIRVVPVLVQDATMPNPRDLPDAMAGLARRNAFQLHDTRFRRDTTTLIQALEISQGAPATPKAAPRIALRSIWRSPWAIGASLLLLVAIGIGMRGWPIWKALTGGVLTATREPQPTVLPRPPAAISVPTPATPPAPTARVLFDDDFRSQRQWMTGVRGCANTRYTNEGYVFRNVASSPNQFCWISLHTTSGKSSLYFNGPITAQLSVRLVRGDESGGYGLIFGTLNERSDSPFYVFQISASGEHKLSYFNNGWTDLSPWNSDGVIRHGYGAANNLAVEIQGSAIQTIVNGRGVGSAQAQSEVRGYVGILLTQPGMEAVFSSLRVLGHPSSP